MDIFTSKILNWHNKFYAKTIGKKDIKSFKLIKVPGISFVGKIKVNYEGKVYENVEEFDQRSYESDMRKYNR